jgi:hypothetical protein
MRLTPLNDRAIGLDEHADMSGEVVTEARDRATSRAVGRHIYMCLPKSPWKNQLPQSYYGKSLRPADHARTRYAMLRVKDAGALAARLVDREPWEAERRFSVVCRLQAIAT